MSNIKGFYEFMGLKFISEGVRTPDPVDFKEARHIILTNEKIKGSVVEGFKPLGNSTYALLTQNKDGPYKIAKYKLNIKSEKLVENASIKTEAEANSIFSRIK